MLFSSLTFLFVFLPVVVIGYYLINPILRNYWLLVMSLLFYAWGEPKYITVMVSVILINYIAGILLDRSIHSRKLVLVITLILNIGCLCYFKYTDFLISNCNMLLHSNIDLKHIVLPIGISFYVFQSMSYTIDVYRKIVQAQHNFCNFALYVSLFPQLVAGPIVRYRDIASQIDSRDVAIDKIANGMRRFIIGLSKKVLLANTMGEVADKVFATGMNDIGIAVAWLGAITYSLQIFFDFSGYSDMAIGLGKIFGFDILENFNYPYVASSITDFWRRWHISLSSWFKEYLYIPLGGNRVSELRRNINLLIVFLATGLWHGASWNFVIWGLWHGFFLVCEKYSKFDLVRNNFCKKLLQHVYVVVVFVIGWVLFRSDNLSNAVSYIGVMCGIKINAFTNFGWSYYCTPKVVLFGVIAVLLSYPWNFSCICMKNKIFSRGMRDLFLVFLLIACIASIAASGYNPFIYFRF